jgi:membrane-bound lytic murein transglycosylase A
VSSLVDIFFVEIQGSGLIRLPDGRKILIGYEQENGHPYKAIGALLIHENHVPREEMSMQRIKQWLAENPDHVDRVLNYNPSFVFFKENPEGPLGNINITLVPRRSIAADQRFYSPAALAIVDLPKPKVAESGEIEASHERLQNLAFVNDTGGAIKGSGRIDIYWGSGNEAEAYAGITNHMGLIYILLPKEDKSLSSL